MRSLPVSMVVAVTLALAACGDSAPPPRGPEPARHTAPTGPKAERRAAASGSFHSTGMTYDEALAVPEELDLVKREPELSNAELAAPLRNATFISECGAPDSTKVVVKVAVKDGHAMGVSVALTPDDPDAAQCIDKAVRAFTWPASKKRFSFTTVY